MVWIPVGPQARFSASLCLFVLSTITLLYLYQDSVPIVQKLATGTGFRSKSVYESALQHDPPPDKPPYGDLILAAQNTTETGWTVFASVEWNVFQYRVDQPDNPNPALQFPKSKGHEAMVYLSYIIDHYDDLPWCAMFIHGHRQSWHQEDEITRLINGLNRVALARAGYISLRCEWYPSCPAEMQPVNNHLSAVTGPNKYGQGQEAAIAGNWRQLFPGVEMPEVIAAPCCAQFAVTRQAIIKRPKSEYERLRDWLSTSLLDDDISGRVFEKLWAYIFTGEAVHCPPPELCACEYFGRCGDEEEEFESGQIPG